MLTPPTEKQQGEKKNIEKEPPDDKSQNEAKKNKLPEPLGTDIIDKLLEYDQETY